MKIKLNRITLENYKCFPSKVVEFFQKTEISGRNQQGKSTLMNAYLDVITSKEANGSMPDGVRPHDSNGEEIPKVDVIRELDLEIDGKPTTIRKITKQKWRKPHGQTQEVFDGNVTTYEIDGFATKQKDFAEFMAKIAKPDILLMCSNANPFLSVLQKSTAEARKILEKLAGFDLDEFIREMGTDYADIADICKGHSLEDVLKTKRKQLVEQKKKIEAQNTKIAYERTRGADAQQVEVADLELAKGEWREKLAALDEVEKSLDEAVKTYDALSAEIREIKQTASDFKYHSNESLSNQRVDLRTKIGEVETQKRILESDLKETKFSLLQSENDISFNRKMVEKAQADYVECTKREFDETKLHQIEAEQFDENSLICPTCGQAFPEDKQEEKRSLFESGKAKRIHDERLCKIRFEEETDVLLAKIIESGNLANERLKAAQKRKEDAEKKIDMVQQEIQKVLAEIDCLNAELAKLPQEVDLSGNTEYQQLLNQIAEKEKALSSLNNGSEHRATIRQKRNEYLAEIYKIDGQIQKQNADAEEKERRLAELESDLRSMSQVAADIEKQIDMVMNFSIQKNEELAKRINPYFDAFDFVFTDMTNEGNLYETLKIVRNGTDYLRGLNYSDRILCDISLVCGLQKLNGLNLPVWVDNVESVNFDRLPEIEQQMILLRVSDGDLKVQEI